MTFLQWLRKQAKRDDPIGDLARDVRQAGDFPKRMTHLSRLEQYLLGKGACDGAVDALHKAWDEFEKTRPCLSATPLSNHARFSVLLRDGFRCQYCGRTPKDDGITLEVDHIMAVADGGTHSPDNLITACEACNQGKSDGMIVDINPRDHDLEG